MHSLFQLINGHTLFDYDININDIIQLCVRNVAPPKPKVEEEKEEEVRHYDLCSFYVY